MNENRMNIEVASKQEEFAKEKNDIIMFGHNVRMATATTTAPTAEKKTRKANNSINSGNSSNT